MALAPLLLVVAAALIHATWNLMSKRAAAGGAAFVFAYNGVCCVAYAPWAFWQMAHSQTPWTWPMSLCLALSGTIHVAYSVTLQRGYQVAPLSVVYPVARGTGPLLSSLGAFLLLREVPTLHGVAGLLCVVAGIALISTQGRVAAFREPGGLTGLRWGATIGACIAAYTISDAFAVKALGVPPILLDWGSNLVRLIVLGPWVLSRPATLGARMTGHWRLAVGVGLLSPLAYILVLLALQMGTPLSIVAPAREMSMMIGALMGMLILHEPVGAWRLVGCAVLIVGVVLLGA